jgi:hypothetical protein
MTLIFPFQDLLHCLYYFRAVAQMTVEADGILELFCRHFNIYSRFPNGIRVN